MTNEVYVNLVEHHTSQRREMSQVKGDEYANDNDRLMNFKRNAKALGVTPEMILMVYAEKHFSAIQNYVKRGCPYNDPKTSEPILGRIYDLQNYMDLLIALLVEKHEDHAPKIVQVNDPSDHFECQRAIADATRSADR